MIAGDKSLAIPGVVYPNNRLGFAAKTIKDIRRATRKQYPAEEKICIVLDGLRGEESIAELCRREGIAQSIYYSVVRLNKTDT